MCATRQAKLMTIARFLIGYEPGMTVIEQANKLLDLLEGKMKGKGKKKKGC